MSGTYQTGYVQKKALADGSVVYRAFWNERQSDGTWKRKAKTLDRGLGPKDAQAELNRILAGVNMGNTAPVKPTITFKDLIDKHWAAYLDKEQLRDSTRDGYSAMMDKWVMPYFEKMPLSSITPETVSSFMGSLVSSKLSDKYRKNIYSLINFIFELARTFDLITVSPVRPLIHRPSVTRKEKQVFPLEKGRKFFEALPVSWRAPVATLLLTGMRQGELLGLRWMDVDFKSRMIHKTNVVYRGRLVEGLKQTRKTGSLRQHQVGMSDTLKLVLESHLATTLHNKPEDYVFCKDTGKPLDPDYMRVSVIYPALKAAEIEVQAYASGLHMFRHTVVSEVAKRMGLKAAAEQAGHAGIEITANVYTHVDSEQKLASAAILGDSFGGFLPESNLTN